jgi:D-lactate dehydrogenase
MPSRSVIHDRYDDLYGILSRSIPEERLVRDPLRTLAYGTDASFYRLIPKLVVRVQSEAEVVSIVRACAGLDIPYTFRAAGTSLSGQALSDSVLIQMSRLWNGIHLDADGTKARLDPAVLGGEANRALACFGKKIGPDPASIDSAMIAGIAANNASGMCCGNIQDTYHTMSSVQLVLTDGSILDTGSAESRRIFLAENHDLVSKIDALAKATKANPVLSKRIRSKYRIKNTTGYSLHALIDFDDPVEVIAHLLIGSEGTLGFISEITYNTVADPPFRATSLVLFADIHSACNTSHRLSKSPVAAVELMDRQSLRAVENKPGIPAYFRTLEENVTALLVEVQAESTNALQSRIEDIGGILAECNPLEAVSFTEDKLQSKRLWEIRKGLFPSLGYARQNGTTIIIEDVAFLPEHLADAAVDLRRLFEKHHYHDAVIFGHALQGNLHFVFCVDFNRKAEVDQYAAFLEDIASLVTEKYNGSLKAEHGTGRNMSPFVEREWGAEAFAIMREIKQIFDPQNLLNPGVIVSNDPQIHISNLKRTPASHPAIEKCTECGFCERTCPSRHLSLTPRQRITAWRDISHLTATGKDRKRLRQMRREFDYAADQTCAVDGLCATLCPLGIDTGAFIKELRNADNSSIAQLLAGIISKHFGAALSLSRTLLAMANTAHSILGTSAMVRFTSDLRKLSGNLFPAWNAWLPKPASRTSQLGTSRTSDMVVYFPSCVSRLFGISAGSPYADSQNTRIESLLTKAGYTAFYPDDLDNLCCGMAFSSKGFAIQADNKLGQLTAALIKVSQNGKYPILIDTSPCAQRLKEYESNYPSLQFYDISNFLNEFVVPRVQFQKRPGTVAIHVPCSLRKTAQGNRLLDLARMCAEHVCAPDSTPCCGFAGDRGFTNPELTASALVSLRPSLSADCHTGYSTSRTCEIGVSLHSGISYQSIAYLVDEAIKTV